MNKVRTAQIAYVAIFTLFVGSASYLRTGRVGLSLLWSIFVGLLFCAAVVINSYVHKNMKK